MKFEYNPETKTTDCLLEEDTDLCFDCYHECNCPLLACIQYHMVYPKDGLEIKFCDMFVGDKNE